MAYSEILHRDDHFDGINLFFEQLGEQGLVGLLVLHQQCLHPVQVFLPAEEVGAEVVEPDFEEISVIVFLDVLDFEEPQLSKSLTIFPLVDVEEAGG